MLLGNKAKNLHGFCHPSTSSWCQAGEEAWSAQGMWWHLEHFLEQCVILPLWAFPQSWILHILKPRATSCTPGSFQSQAHVHYWLLTGDHWERKRGFTTLWQHGLFSSDSFWGLHHSSPPRPCFCAVWVLHPWAYEVVVDVLACPGTNHTLSPYGNYQSWFRRNPLWRRSLACPLLCKVHEVLPKQGTSTSIANSEIGEIQTVTIYHMKRLARYYHRDIINSCFYGRNHKAFVDTYKNLVSRNSVILSCSACTLHSRLPDLANTGTYICRLRSYKNPETNSVHDFFLTEMYCYLRLT